MTWNSAQRFSKGAKDEIGFPQFQGADSAFLVANGMIMQAGKTGSLAVGNHDIAFPAPFTKQILCIMVTPRNAEAAQWAILDAGSNLEKFQLKVATIAAPFYWFAWGV